jgi:hypothetical protein
VAATGLIVAVCLGTVLGPWKSSIGARKFRGLFAMPVPSPSIPPPSNPAKEYIYVGGRLVATEEPQGGNLALNRPTNLNILQWCQAHASWTDNSSDETGFKVELSQNGGNNFFVFTTVPANTTQALFLPMPRWKDSPFVYRIRATNTAGDSLPSNSFTIQPPMQCSGGCLCLDGAPGIQQTVWVDEHLPAGAVPAGEESWNWVNANPDPFSRELSSQSSIQTGFHQHYFSGATETLPVGAEDWLIAYVYLDSANPPSEVMLQWNDGAGGWEHRAYWGANSINAGVYGTNSRRSMGPLPPSGQWVRLEVAASQVGLGGSTLNGLALTLFGGRASWDYIGKADHSLSNQNNQAAPTSLMATAWSGSQINISWNGVSDAHHYQLERSQNIASGYSVIVSSLTATSFMDTVTPGAAYLYRVRAVNASGTVSAPSNADLATAIVFTDDPLVIGLTSIKAQHIAELRQAANAVRALANLGAAGWTDSSLSGVNIKAVHIQEVRAGLDQAFSLLGQPVNQYTDPSLPGLTARKVHIDEIRQRVK